MAADFIESFEDIISEGTNQNAVLTYMTMLDDQKTMNQLDIKEWNRRSQIMDLLITKNALLDCNANWISSQLIGRRLCSKVPFQLFSLRS